MDKFYVGDRVRLVKDNKAWSSSNMWKEGVVLRTGLFNGRIEVKFYNSENEFYGIDFGNPCALELVEKADAHPEEITHNGVIYIRKPEPEHIWKFGDWARIKPGASYAGSIVFVTGPISKYGSVPFARNGHHSRFHADGHHPENLEYISSATIPE